MRLDASALLNHGSLLNPATLGLITPTWICVTRFWCIKKGLAIIHTDQRSRRCPRIPRDHRLAVRCNREAKSQSVEQRIQTLQFRVPAHREHLVQAFTVEFGFPSKLRHASMCFRYVSQRQQKQFGIIFLQSRVQILFGFPHVAQTLN